MRYFRIAPQLMISPSRCLHASHALHIMIRRIASFLRNSRNPAKIRNPGYRPPLPAVQTALQQFLKLVPVYLTVSAERHIVNLPKTVWNHIGRQPVPQLTAQRTFVNVSLIEAYNLILRLIIEAAASLDFFHPVQCVLNLPQLNAMSHMLDLKISP